MLNRIFNATSSPIRITLAMLAGLLLLSGCGSDKKKDEDKKDEKKPAYERVVILKQRFEQLENSLDEMERDLIIQKKRIESTRETAKSIKRSLLKGNLKGYSLSTITSDPLVLSAIQKHENKELKEKIEKDEKKESSDTFLNLFLIAGFICFLVAVFVVALKDRKQATPYDTNLTPNFPESDPLAEPDSNEITPEDEPETEGEYGELNPYNRDNESHSDLPSDDNEEPRS